jgi:N-acetylglutamate synthase-like GNAT family acetyltransferase
MLRHAGIVLLAKSEDKVVGALRALTDFASVCVICDVVVDTKFQGHGVGSQLVVELQQAIAKRCPVSVVSKVEPTFFSHIGFAPVAGLQRS